MFYHQIDNNIFRMLLFVWDVTWCIPHKFICEDNVNKDGGSKLSRHSSKILVWDATIRDTSAPSYIHSSSMLDVELLPRKMIVEILWKIIILFFHLLT